MRASIVIAGGGIIGSAVAYCLAERGWRDVCVVDLDLAGIYASSELNAGGVRATWWQPVNIETCRQTLDFFRERREEFGFRERGYLWLYDDPEALRIAREKQALQNAQGLGVELLGPGEIAAHCPLLDSHLDEIIGATFSPRDGLINPNAVRAYYRREAEALGVRFLNRHYVDGVVTARVRGENGTRRVEAIDVIEVAGVDAADASGALREILTSHRIDRARRLRETRIECEILINCLGAWSTVFSGKLGIRDVTEAVRRQICLVGFERAALPEGFDFDALGMVVDASDLYFHPEGGHVLAGYSIPAEAPGFDFTYDGADFFESFIWPRLAHRASAFERCGHVRGWSGLYAVTPDCSGIAGPVPGIANLYEAHSFTGRGVMQSFGVARALAERIVDGASSSCDLAPLGRQRFATRESWLPESLHI